MSRSAIEHPSTFLKLDRRPADMRWLATTDLAPRIERMNLEERTLETVGERCEECGAKLTDAELKAAMESGGPALCTVHAVEATPLDPDALDEPPA
jgi:uncharacterized protein with PIN domain